MNEFGAEFAAPASSWFDVFVNGLNRLPRPMLALGTLGLFVYAMPAPAGFSLRMQGLALVPEPLWWLLGAIVSFYFGARELHHQRTRSRAALPRSRRSASRACSSPAPRPAAPRHTGRSRRERRRRGVAPPPLRPRLRRGNRGGKASLHPPRFRAIVAAPGTRGGVA